MIIIKEVGQFLIKEQLFYNIDNTLYLEDKEFLTLRNKIIDFHKNTNLLFVESFGSNGFEITSVFNLVSQHIEFEKAFVVRNSFNSFISMFSFDTEFNSYFQIFDSVKSLLFPLSIVNISKYSILNETFVIIERDQNELSLFDFKNNIQIWNYDFVFPQYYDAGFCRYEDVELEQFIGVFNNELWILFSGNRILVLDIETGKEVYQYESLETILETSFSIKNCFVDEQRGVVKVLAYRYYIEIEMTSKKSQIKKDFGDLSVGGFTVVDGSYYGDQYIYFVGCKYNSEKLSIGNNLAGVFNTSTLEIEWMYELEVKEKNHFFIGVPQANDKYFGVKDSESSLFLFERNEMIK